MSLVGRNILNSEIAVRFRMMHIFYTIGIILHIVYYSFEQIAFCGSTYAILRNLLPHLYNQYIYILIGHNSISRFFRSGTSTDRQAMF